MIPLWLPGSPFWCHVWYKPSAMKNTPQLYPNSAYALLSSLPTCPPSPCCWKVIYFLTAWKIFLLFSFKQKSLLPIYLFGPATKQLQELLNLVFWCFWTSRCYDHRYVITEWDKNASKYKSGNPGFVSLLPIWHKRTWVLGAKKGWKISHLMSWSSRWCLNERY